jgi:protein ImuB
MLWIALHLPWLSLEAFAATLAQAAAGRPLALFDPQGITSANAAARALGVQPGLKRATALALAPQLVLGKADAARDAQALAAVAHVALNFTPSVALQTAGAVAPDTVLLEVQASLRHFGGAGRRLETLLWRLRDALEPLAHSIHIASAPTPLGAALLARVHRELHCADRHSLARALGAAPAWLLGAGREHAQALQGMGLGTIGLLQRLPRSGLARRFGESLLDEIDRAFGDKPDPREPIVLPDGFESRLELFARADTTEQVLCGAGMLLARMVAWLSAQHAFVRRFTLVMQHEKRWRADAQTPTATTLVLALAEPSRDPAHLLVLLRERLAQLQMPAPSIELRLRVDDVARRAPPNSELFPTPGSEREGLTRLVERLQARLGPQQVRRLVLLQDHRPECGGAMRAAQAVLPGARLAGDTGAARAAVAAAAAAVRPVWLLAQPQALPERQHRPVLDGQALQLLCGPERIEAGWWDGGLAERDYFIAQASDGALVWIYRGRLPLSAAGQQGWFLQGRFG